LQAVAFIGCHDDSIYYVTFTYLLIKFAQFLLAFHFPFAEIFLVCLLSLVKLKNINEPLHYCLGRGVGGKAANQLFVFEGRAWAY